MNSATPDPLRVDLLLHRLCLTRSRSEAKAACDAGAVSVGQRPVRASHEVSAGDEVEIRFPGRVLRIRVERLPPKSTSKKAAREMYTIVGEERS